MELISVIVPIYKVEAYLDRCVQSIVDQSYQNLEIILVDDGSPDRCPEMCDAWAKKDPRIQVVHKKNGGQSDARNVGLEHANGSYICFIDSDDWVDPQYIEFLYKALKQTGADLSACSYRQVFENTSNIGTVSQPFSVQAFSPEEALQTLIRGQGFCAVVWNKLYSAKLLHGETFSLGKCIDDEFFTYRILAKTTYTAFVDVPLYNYLQRPGSIMSSFTIRHLEALDAYLERLSLFKREFPRLYFEDSASFSIACANFYIATKKSTSPAQSEMIHIIKNRRKQMKYPLSLLRKHSLRNIIYILGTGLAIGPFCWILQKTRKD